jgi:hypothetical protein
MEAKLPFVDGNSDGTREFCEMPVMLAVGFGS